VAAAGREIGDADDLHDALAAATPPFEIGIVRGAEERTVNVGSEPGRTPGDA
jgi:hypothetical protein